MAALLSKQIDAAQAMIYNEYAQVLEQKNPATGALYQPTDLNVIDWNKDGVAMLQDAIWANTDKLKNDTAYQDTAVKLLKGAIGGWVYCRDNFQPCVDIVLKNGPTLGSLAPGLAAGPGERARLAVARRDRRRGQGGCGTRRCPWRPARRSVTAAPDADAYSNTYVQKAVDALKASGMDVTGSSYKAPEVTLKEGGK